MACHPAVGINDNFAPRESAVAQWATDDKVAGRIDVEERLLMQPLSEEFHKLRVKSMVLRLVKTLPATNPGFRKVLDTSFMMAAMVADRLDKVAYPRALDLFFDFVGAGEARNAGYHAAANFEAEAAATQVAQPALVIATHSSLRDGTLQVAKWLPQATLVERDDITMPAFELGAESIASLARDFVT